MRGSGFLFKTKRGTVVTRGSAPMYARNGPCGRSSSTAVDMERPDPPAGDLQLLNIAYVRAVLIESAPRNDCGSVATSRSSGLVKGGALRTVLKPRILFLKTERSRWGSEEQRKTAPYCYCRRQSRRLPTVRLVSGAVSIS